MSETTNLGLTAMAENENQKYLRFNTAVERLAAATAARLSVSVSSGNATPTQEQVRACQLLQITGASTAGRTVTIPSVTRTLLIHSVEANTQNVSLARGSTTLTIAPGEGKLVFIGSGAGDLTEILSSEGGAGSIVIEENDSVVVSAATTINFRGSVSVVENTGGIATVEYSGGGGGVVTVSTVSTVSHTPEVAEAGYYFRCTNAGGCTITIPQNTSEPFQIGSMLTYEQGNTGGLTFDGDVGVTINVAAAFMASTVDQYAVVQLIKVGTDTWTIYGNLEAA